MDKQQTSQNRIKELLVETLLQEIPGCTAIYRFGSWGTDAERPDSDVDIAVLPPHPLQPVPRWELAQKLADIARRDVDLVDLLTASTVLRMQVVAHGELLHCASRSEVDRFEIMVFSSYARLNEERREILEDVQKRGRVYGE